MKKFLFLVFLVLIPSVCIASGYWATQKGTSNTVLPLIAPLSHGTLTFANAGTTQCVTVTNAASIKFNARLADTALATGTAQTVRVIVQGTAGTIPALNGGGYINSTGDAYAIGSGVTKICFKPYSTASPVAKYVDYVTR